VSGSPRAPAAVEQARVVLQELGISGAHIEAAGHDGSVAVVTAAASGPDLLLDPLGDELVRRLKALGFRYVAVELDGGV